MGVSQVLWVPAKSECLPFSFCPPPAPLLRKALSTVLSLVFIWGTGAFEVLARPKRQTDRMRM